MKRHLIALSISLVAACSLGLVVSRHWKSPPPPREISPPISTLTPAERQQNLMMNWMNLTDNSVSPQRAIQAAQLLDGCTAAECLALATQLMSVEAKTRRHGDMLEDVIDRWAKLEPESAMNWAMQHPERMAPNMDEIGKSWAQKDPAGAIAWLLAVGDLPNEDGGQPPKLRLEQWFPEHPELVLRYQLARCQKHGQSEAYELYWQPLTTGTYRAIGTELATFPAETYTAPRTSTWAKAAAKRFRDSWISTDPSAWLAWADAHPAVAQAARGEAVNDAQEIFKSTPADSRSAAADAWLALAESTKRPQVLRDIIADWSAEDLNQAGSWLQKLPDSPDRWEAVATFAKRAIKEDPEAALTWAATITDAPKRYQAERDAYLQWHRHAPAEAQQWLNERSGWNAAQSAEAAEWLAVQR